MTEGGSNLAAGVRSDGAVVEANPSARLPREFVYSPLDETAGRDGVLVLYRLFWLPLVLATAGGRIAGSVGAIAGLLGGVAYAVRAWRTRKRTVRGAVLTVANKMVTVTIRGARVVYECFGLAELADVTLELKTIERVMDGASALPALRLINSRVGPKVDTARILLVDAEGREVCLTDEYWPHSEAIQSMGKMRSFLRKHGWVPEGERPLAELRSQRGGGPVGGEH